MIDILSEGAAAVLDDVARERMLLVLDFDGTLAPIVADRAAAAMRPATRALLKLASILYPCAVLSGRARADVAPRVDGIPLLAVVGNHGAEAGHGPVDRSLRAAIVGWRTAVEARLRGVAGVEVEDKGLSIAIHYRGAPDPAAARDAVHASVEGLAGARVFGGHAVVNVVPADAQDKGAALAELLTRAVRRRALYVGDDATDEDAFRRPEVAVGVRVGEAEVSAASHYVPSQDRVDDLLRAVVRARLRLDGLEDRTESLERLMRVAP